MSNVDEYGQIKRGNTPTTKSNDSCYIATACYGNYDAPEVITFRNFRDKKLLNNSYGKSFVKFYYKYSPFWANKLKNYPNINQFVRKIILDNIYFLLRNKV